MTTKPNHGLTPDQSLPSDAAASERREEARVSARLEVRFPVVAQATRAFRAYSLNVSLGGLCLKPNRPHPVGSALQLVLHFQSETFEVEGVVAWSRDGAIGVRFVGLEDSERERLASLTGLVIQGDGY